MVISSTTVCRRFGASDVVALITTLTVALLLYALTVKEITYLHQRSVQYSASDMNVLQVNIQSINTSKRLLQTAAANHSADVILLQEVWSPKEEVGIHNFLPPIIKSRENNQFGGVAILAQKNAKIVHWKEYEIPQLEAVWAEVQIGSERILCGSVYINVGKTAEIHLLDSVLDRITLLHKRILIGMDANSRNLLWDNSCLFASRYSKSRKMGVALEDLITKHGLAIHNNGASTYQSGTISTAPDVTLSLGVIDSSPLNWKILEDDLNSPHSAVLSQIGRKKVFEPVEVVDWEKFSWCEYEKSSKVVLSNLHQTWLQSTTLSADVMVEEFHTAISGIVDDLSSTKTVSPHSKPWVDRQCAASLKDLRNGRRAYSRHRSEGNLRALLELRVKAIDSLNSSRLNWINSQCGKLPLVSEKEKWNIINKLTNSTTNFQVQPLVVTQDDGTSKFVFSDEEILHQMEEYHISKDQDSSDVSRSKQSISEMKADAWQNIDGDDSIMNDSISAEEVDLTFNISTGAPGPEGFLARLIDKADRDNVSICLQLMWNQLWIEGSFLGDWKREQRVVIPKLDKKDFHHCNSYRTVSVTAVLGKRFEKITCRRLMSILEEIGFDVDQFAYLESRSATQAMFSLLERIKLGVLEGRSCGAIFFDFTDAFGSVDRSLLLGKLRRDFGIRGRLFLHLADFLSERTARLKIAGTMGEWMGTNVGTSAGTVLGPILFICHTHDAPKRIFPKFADDFSGIAVEDSDCAMEDKLQIYADEMSEWSTRNAMQLNSKTKVMSFGSCQHELCVFVNGKQLEEAKFLKYLGIWLDRDLSFEKHVEYACGKAKSAFRKICILLNGRQGLSIKIGLEIYKALIRPHLEYAVPAWAFRGTRFIKQFEVVQSQCLSSITGSFKSSSVAAVEVLSSIQPISLRFKELCLREWARIKAFPANHPLSVMLSCASANRTASTPLGYIAHISRHFAAMMESNGWISMQRQPLTPPLLRQQRAFEMCNIFTGSVGSAKSRSCEQKRVALTEMNIFLQKHQSESIIIFSDGSAKDENGGCGSILLSPDGELDTKSCPVSCNGDNVECEVAGLALSFTQAVQYAHLTNRRAMSFFILSDCESALEIVQRQRDVGRWLQYFQTVWSCDDELRRRTIKIILGWVPGHCGIVYNELADRAAKQACTAHVRSELSPLSLERVVQKVKEVCLEEWQRSWDRSPTGQFTRVIVPRAGSKLKYPDCRSTGMTMIRCLLNNAAVADILFRFRLVDSPDCQCGEARETVDHVLLQCPRFDLERLVLKSQLCDKWFQSRRPGNLHLDLNLLLNPSSTGMLTGSECTDIMEIVHQFLTHIKV